MPFRSLAILVTTLAAACATSQRGAPPPPALPAPSSTPPAASPTFEASVRPVLARRCDPCHNPGGRMYERLPFDDAEVVAGNREGVGRRLKDPGEKAAFERWLEARDREGQATRSRPASLAR
jgi:hypothetical protein